MGLLISRNISVIADHLSDEDSKTLQNRINKVLQGDQ